MGWPTVEECQRDRVDNNDRTTTHRYYQEDVHDFAWTTSPDYLERTARFCEIYDNPAFDPGMESAPLAFFEPMLRNVFSFPKNSIYRNTCEM